jgi:hypothetical protein
MTVPANQGSCKSNCYIDRERMAKHEVHFLAASLINQLPTLFRSPHEELVKIYVSTLPPTAMFTVRPDFLTHCAAFFAAAFSGSFAQAITKSIL